MYLTAPQISALAQLLLQKGNWKGGQLVPSWWIEEMGKPRVEIPGDEKKALTHYAYHIKAGKEIFAAEGAFGQYLIFRWQLESQQVRENILPQISV